MASSEIIESATVFFGEQGLGLQETERNPCCIGFEGGGGHVSVTIVDGEKKRTVDVETREWEYQAEKFLGKL